MIKNRLVLKYYLLAILTIVAFVVLGFFTQRFLERSLLQSEMHFPTMKPPIYLAKVLDRFNSQDKIAGLKELQNLMADENAPELSLFNENGEQIFPDTSTAGKEKIDPKTLKSLQHEYDFHTERFDGFGPPTGLPPGPPPDGPPMGMPPGPPPNAQMNHEGPPPPPPMMEEVLVRLSGQPLYFLKIKPPRPKDFPRPNRFFPLFALLSLIGSLALGIGVTIFIVYSAIVKHTRTADEVIAKLQNGDLKARFPIERNDEVGKAKMRFNKMADEIELLVEHLRSIETSRVQLMQELAHDLRTPIASLKNLIETLQYRDQQLEPKVKVELLSLSAKEIDYFERLVEDLLLLAQVSEPKYKAGADTIDITQLVAESIYEVELKENSRGHSIEITGNFQPESRTLIGDPHLLKRLFRNALENAASFAKQKVSVSITQAESGYKVSIVDDGPGFSQTALNEFGNRRISRKIQTETSSRVSVGLGSVIMKTITNLHRGQLLASNELDQNNKVIGGRVEISLS